MTHEYNITLEGVLIALQKSPKTTKIVVDDYGVFWDLNTLRNSTIEGKGCGWRLRRPLHEQPAKTIKFLNKIIL